MVPYPIQCGNAIHILSNNYQFNRSRILGVICEGSSEGLKSDLRDSPYFHAIVIDTSINVGEWSITSTFIDGLRRRLTSTLEKPKQHERLHERLS